MWFVAGGRGTRYSCLQCPWLWGGRSGGYNPLPRPQPLQADVLVGEHGAGGKEVHRPGAGEGSRPGLCKNQGGHPWYRWAWENRISCGAEG